MSVAKLSLQLSGLFEAELLTELMLRYWQHPLAADREFRNALLESAVLALQHAVDGEQLVEGLSPENMNLVAAIWYSEWAALSSSEDERLSEVFSLRDRWLDKVRQSVPSCFTDDISS